MGVAVNQAKINRAEAATQVVEALLTVARNLRACAPNEAVREEASVRIAALEMDLLLRKRAARNDRGGAVVAEEAEARLALESLGTLYKALPGHTHPPALENAALIVARFIAEQMPQGSSGDALNWLQKRRPYDAQPLRV